MSAKHRGSQVVISFIVQILQSIATQHISSMRHFPSFTCINLAEKDVVFTLWKHPLKKDSAGGGMETWRPC